MFYWRVLGESDIDWWAVDELDEYRAAVLAAEQYDKEDYRIAKGKIVTFEIKDEQGNLTTWIVRGDIIPVYYASLTDKNSVTY